MSARTRRAIALLEEAANPVHAGAFTPPALALDGRLAGPAPGSPPAARSGPRRRRGRRRGGAILLLPGTGDEDVVARAAAAVSGDAVVFTEARKVEYGRVVSRELSWMSGDGTRRRMLIYKPGGRLESEIVVTPERSSRFMPGEREVEVFEGFGSVMGEFEGDPLTLLARARKGRDGLKLVGEDRIDGRRVHVIAVHSPTAVGTPTIAVSAKMYLPVTATIGLSTYQYDRVEKLPDADALRHRRSARSARECACSERRTPLPAPGLDAPRSAGRRPVARAVSHRRCPRYH